MASLGFGTEMFGKFRNIQTDHETSEFWDGLSWNVESFPASSKWLWCCNSDVLLLMFILLLPSFKGVLALTQTCSTIQLFGGVYRRNQKKHGTTSFSAIWLSRALMRSACSLGRVVGSPGISRSCSPGILVGSSKASCIHGCLFPIWMTIHSKDSKVA